MADFTLADLEAIIAKRAGANPDESWTARLVERGIKKAAEKVGEEATETIIAAVARGKKGLRDESADLLFHLLVVLHMRGVSVDDVMTELEKRTAQSGLTEKAARKG